MIATDPSTTRDIPRFCQFLGFSLLEQKEENELFFYYVQKPV
ncbi:sulfurtransferase TusA family protein [Oceanospirillum sp. HFRX-1_2]